MASTRGTLDEIVASFSALKDPRSPLHRRHPLPSILALAVWAVRAGAAAPTASARWAELKEDLLTDRLDRPHGVPGTDVFRRVLMLLKPAAFEAAFNAGSARLRDEATAETGVARPLLAVDGKTARRSHGVNEGHAPLHVKSHESTAIPELLRTIDVRGGIVTIDAMAAPKAIAREVIRGAADSVLALKGNHESRHRAVIEPIDERLERDLEGAQELTTTERGHRREEERTDLQRPAPEALPGQEQWDGLKSVGVVPARRLEGDREGLEIRYDLSSLPVNAKRFRRAVRGHWSVENACPWTLDVTFREDDARIRERVLGTNIPWLYRFTLSILKQHTDRRMSPIRKRRACGWSEKFLMEVIDALVC